MAKYKELHNIPPVKVSEKSRKEIDSLVRGRMPTGFLEHSQTEKTKAILNKLLHTLREHYPEYANINIALRHVVAKENKPPSLAAAVPTGKILIAQIIRDLSNSGNDSLIGWVLAHEIGHVIASHQAKEMVSAILMRTANTLLALSPDEEEKLFKYATNTETRHNEYEADALGAELASQSGYDIEKALRQFVHLIEAIVTTTNMAESMAKYQLIKNDPLNESDRLDGKIDHDHPLDRKRYDALNHITPTKEIEESESIYSPELSQILKKHGLAFGVVYKDDDGSKAVVIDSRNDKIYAIEIKKNSEFESYSETKLKPAFKSEVNAHGMLETPEQLYKNMHEMFNMHNPTDATLFIYERLSPSTRGDIEQLLIKMNKEQGPMIYIKANNIGGVDNVQIKPTEHKLVSCDDVGVSYVDNPLCENPEVFR